MSAALAALVSAQAPREKEPAWPATGVDYSGIDEFYRIVDVYAKGATPSEAQWRALLATPGYRLVEIDNEGVRGRIELAFSPSLRSKRDSVLGTNSGQSSVLKHLLRAVERRDEVKRSRAALERSIADSIAIAARAASRFLPAGTVEARSYPFIGFAVFADDGYAEDPGVLLDPLDVLEEGLMGILSHEFHHSYAGPLDRTLIADLFRGNAKPPSDIALALPLIHLRNEGIADQIDKPHPLPPGPAALAWYVSGYNDAYARTPAILRSIDSLLVAFAGDSSTVQAAGRQARRLLYSNSHPNGAYMAREIVETFGIDSLMPGIYNPFAFFRAYEAAEARRGNPPPFSRAALRVLADMERRYLKP